MRTCYGFSQDPAGIRRCQFHQKTFATSSLNIRHVHDLQNVTWNMTSRSLPSWSGPSRMAFVLHFFHDWDFKSGNILAFIPFALADILFSVFSFRCTFFSACIKYIFSKCQDGFTAQGLLIVWNGPPTQFPASALEFNKLPLQYFSKKRIQGTLHFNFNYHKFVFWRVSVKVMQHSA